MRRLLPFFLLLFAAPASAQIARVGDAARTIGTSASATTQTSPAFNITAGNTVVTWLSAGSNTVAVSGVADNCGNNYASAGAAARITSAAVGQVDIYVKTGAAGGTNCVVTVTWASTVNFRSIIATQWDPTEAIMQVDDADSSSGTGGTATVPSMVSASNDNVFIAFYADDAGANASPGTNYTGITGATDQGIEAEQDINTAQTTQTATWTGFGSATYLVNGLVLSENAGAAAPQRRQRRIQPQ